MARPSTSARKPARKADRIGPADWIRAGVELLAQGGIEAVRVEPLAARLGVTKGSFYWHFKDRGALHAAILERWRARSTADVIALVDGAGGSGAERLRRLFDVTVADNDPRRPQLTNAIRAWSRTDPLAAGVIATADAERIAYVRGLLQAHGLDVKTAELRARLLYLALMGAFALSGERGEAPALWDEAVRQALAD